MTKWIIFLLWTLCPLKICCSYNQLYLFNNRYLKQHRPGPYMTYDRPVIQSRFPLMMHWPAAVSLAAPRYYHRKLVNQNLINALSKSYLMQQSKTEMPRTNESSSQVYHPTIIQSNVANCINGNCFEKVPLQHGCADDALSQQIGNQFTSIPNPFIKTHTNHQTYAPIFQLDNLQETKKNTSSELFSDIPKLMNTPTTMDSSPSLKNVVKLPSLQSVNESSHLVIQNANVEVDIAKSSLTDATISPFTFRQTSWIPKIMSKSNLTHPTVSYSLASNISAPLLEYIREVTPITNLSKNMAVDYFKPELSIFNVSPIKSPNYSTKIGTSWIPKIMPKTNVSYPPDTASSSNVNPRSSSLESKSKALLIDNNSETIGKINLTLPLTNFKLTSNISNSYQNQVQADWIPTARSNPNLKIPTDSNLSPLSMVVNAQLLKSNRSQGHDSENIEMGKLKPQLIEGYINKLSSKMNQTNAHKNSTSKNQLTKLNFNASEAVFQGNLANLSVKSTELKFVNSTILRDSNIKKTNLIETKDDTTVHKECNNCSAENNTLHKVCDNCFPTDNFSSLDNNIIKNSSKIENSDPKYRNASNSRSNYVTRTNHRNYTRNFKVNSSPEVRQVRFAKTNSANKTDEKIENHSEKFRNAKSRRAQTRNNSTNAHKMPRGKSLNQHVSLVTEPADTAIMKISERRHRQYKKKINDFIANKIRTTPHPVLPIEFVFNNVAKTLN